ncbi:MAG: ATP-binding protein [Alphaproteobacteria bacterium]|nr:ATP-binding protein [Alphaproteobacteria bacterium]
MSPILKRLLPRTLLGRTLLIVLIPLLVVQAVAFQIFYGVHLNLVSRRLSAAIVGEIATTVALIERAPDDAGRDWAMRNSWERFEIRMEMQPRGPLPSAAPPGLLSPRSSGFSDGLRDKLQLPYAIDWESDPQSVLVTIGLADGNLHIEAPRKRLFAATLELFLLWLLGSSLLMFGLAALFVRNQVRSIRKLADAAEAFGLGRDGGAIKPEGAAEVRRAAVAFNRMQERIARFLQQRTEMLAGVSHDLRTPLTRLRLALAMMPADAAVQRDVADMTGDVAEMERLIEAYLAFARGEGHEQAQLIDLAVLLGDIAAAARRTGNDLSLAVDNDLVIKLRPDAIRRAVTNLVDNAGRHGRHIALAARRNGERLVEITVEDDGPGIPPERREAVFKPFESQAAGGTGLGLTIARDIVRAHGGDIALEDGALGGLRARITLPV